MKVIAVDPGTERSAWVLYDTDGSVPYGHGIEPNERLCQILWERNGRLAPMLNVRMVVEMVASYGRPVGVEVFETVYWIGRFSEAWERGGGLGGGSAHRIFRREVKQHICQDGRAKDPHIRQALIDRFGPGRAKAIGTSKQPGPLYGIKADEWAALAVAVTFSERGVGCPG